MFYEYVDLGDQSIDSQIIDDLVRKMVDYEGEPDNLQTRAVAHTRLLLARLKVKSKSMLHPPQGDEQDRVWQKYRMAPSRIAFMVNTLLRADARALSDAMYINNTRAKFWLDTSLDVAL